MSRSSTHTPGAIGMKAAFECLNRARFGTARDMPGADGIVDGFGVMRHAQNLESVSACGGADDVQALILGRVITGLSAFA